MPGPQITADLLLNVHSQNLARDLEGALVSGTQRAMRDAQRMVSNTFREATVHALTDGKVGQALRGTIKSGILDAQQQYESLIRQAEATKDKAEKKRLTEQAAATRKLLDERYKEFQRELALQRQGAKAQREGAKRFAEGLESGAQNLRGLLSGGDLFGNLAQAGKGLGGRLQARGETRIAKAREAGLRGADPKQVAQMAKMGQTLAKVGMALATVAAVVGAIVILVKIFADIESKAKDMNKALLESAGAADFGLGHVDVVSGKLNERLQELRENTADLNEVFFNFGASAKEQQAVLSQLNQAGFTYAKMTEGTTSAAQRVQGYADALGAALTYSRALGVSSSQMAQTMGEFTLETGQGLEQIADQFSGITTEAMRAGFVTKRFYASVTAATSGMAFYGVRLEETTKLLASFDSLLGETVGAEAFKRLVGQYRDAGEQKKLQDIIVKGEGLVAKELGKAFDLRVSELQRDFGDRLGGANVAEMLTSMTEQELRQQLERQGFKPEEMRRFATAQRLGAAPGRGKGAMMEAMGAAGPGFDIAMAMNASQVFQGRNVGEVARQARAGGDQGAVRVALSSVADAQGMKLEQLVELFEQADARWQNLERIQQEIKKNAGDRTKLAQEDQDYLQRLEDKFGIEITDLGEKITKDGLEMTEAMDLVRTSSVDSGEKLSDQFSRDQEIAVGISENIYGLNEIMEQTIAKILNDIYGVVAAIARKYLMGSKEMEKVQAIEEARKYREKTQAELEKKHSDLRTIEVKLRTAEGEEREKLLKERETINKDAERAQKDAKRADVLWKAAKTGPAGRTLQRGEQKLAEAGVITQQQASLGGKYAEATIEKMFGEVDASSSGIVAAWSDIPTKTIGVFEDIEAEDITEEMRQGYEALDEETKKAFEKLYGKDAVAEAFKAAEDAAVKKAEEVESVWTTEATEWEQIRGAAVGAFKSKLLQSAGGGEGGAYTLDELRSSMETMPVLGSFNEQIIRNLEMIAKSTDETAHAADTGIRLDLSNATKANDLILPAAGGQPILTDERDTLMAFKPGGPLAGAMGGGGRGGDVHISIYGGDQRQVYDTVMKALKAVGRA
jgi:hypothetical protein